MSASSLLIRNISPARIAGFILSNFLGLAIVLGSLQFYLDARTIWEDDDSFIRSDYIVVNKRVTSANTFAGASSGFSEADLADLSAQPWVRRAAPFESARYRVSASIMQAGRGLSTNMFLESIPGDFVDVPASQWSWREGSDEVPLIISKDYLTLYNFGFASSAGLPQMSEGFMSGLPLMLTLTSDDGRRLEFHGRVAGYSNRLNTILVPREFMEWSNSQLAAGAAKPLPSRVIIEVSSPGDTAIREYIDARDWEIAGDKSAASASFLLKIVAGIVIAIGCVITLLSFFILLLSISLLMEKNREKLHSLIMLGYPLRTLERPYRLIVAGASLLALLLAVGGVFLLRSFYLAPVTGLGAEAASPLAMLAVGIVLTALIILFNDIAVARKVKASFRI